MSTLLPQLSIGRSLALSAIAALCWFTTAVDLRAAPVARDGGALTFDRTGAKVGEQLPDLTVYTLDGQPVAFHRVWDGVVITVSLTCPKSRAKYPDARALADQLKGKTRVSLLYVIEAHPDQDPSPYKNIVDVTPENRRDGILHRQPATLDERLKLARAFRDRFDVPKEIEIYVDGMSNQAWQSVGGGPNMALVVEKHGVVEARQGWFDSPTLKPSAERLPVATRAWVPHALHDAARKGDLEAVELLIHNGSDVNQAMPDGRTPLQFALLYNRGEISKRLLAAGATTNVFSSAALGEVSVVRKMLEADPSLARRRDGDSRSPLHYAAAAGRIDVVKLLLEYGATDERPPGSTDPLALHWAARYGRTAVAELLLNEAGSDVRAKGEVGRTPMDEAEDAAKAKDGPATAAATRDLLKEAWGKPVKPAKVVTAPPVPAVPVPAVPVP